MNKESVEKTLRDSGYSRVYSEYEMFYYITISDQQVERCKMEMMSTTIVYEVWFNPENSYIVILALLQNIPDKDKSTVMRQIKRLYDNERVEELSKNLLSKRCICSNKTVVIYFINNKPIPQKKNYG